MFNLDLRPLAFLFSTLAAPSTTTRTALRHRSTTQHRLHHHPSDRQPKSVSSPSPSHPYKPLSLFAQPSVDIAKGWIFTLKILPFSTRVRASSNPQLTRILRNTPSITNFVLAFHLTRDHSFLARTYSRVTLLQRFPTLAQTNSPETAPSSRADPLARTSLTRRPAVCLLDDSDSQPRPRSTKSHHPTFASSLGQRT